MVSKNDITGDKIQTKIGNDNKYEDNYDAIFRKNKVGNATPTPDKPVEPTEEWDEDRIDTIGSNGNEGLHYDSDK